MHWRRKWQPTPYSCLENPRNGSLVGCRLWGRTSQTRLTWLSGSSNTITAEKATATHSSTLARKIPWMEEPGGLQSMGSLGVGLDWATSLSLFTLMHWRRKWQPTPVFLPEESQGRGAWWAAIYGVTQSRTRLKWLSSSSKSCFRVFICILFVCFCCFASGAAILKHYVHQNHPQNLLEQSAWPHTQNV